MRMDEKRVPRDRISVVAGVENGVEIVGTANDEKIGDAPPQHHRHSSCPCSKEPRAVAGEGCPGWVESRAEGRLIALREKNSC